MHELRSTRLPRPGSRLKRPRSLGHRLAVAVVIVLTCGAWTPAPAGDVSIRLVTGTRVDFGLVANAEAEIGTASVSADGRLVVFESSATNLVPDDLNGSSDIFLYDATAGTLERISVGADGEALAATSEDPSLSGDGRYVLFGTQADNAVPGLFRGLVRLDRTDGSLAPVILDSTGEPLSEVGSGEHHLSADGNLVVFESSRSDIVAGDTNSASDIFVRDMTTDVITRVSVDSAGNEGNGSSTDPVISGDGRFVAFLSAATNLVAGDTEGVTDLFLHDRTAATTVRVSEFAGQGADSGRFDLPAIDAEGSTVLFVSSARNLSDPPTTGTSLLRAYDVPTATLSLVPGLGFASNPAISDDGSLVSSSNFSELSVVPVGDGASPVATYPEAIVGNFGRSNTHFAFRSETTELLPVGQTLALGLDNVFLAELGAPPALVSRATNGPNAGGMTTGFVGEVFLSSDGETGAFFTRSSTLAAEAPGGGGFFFDQRSLELSPRPDTEFLGLSANGRWAVARSQDRRSFTVIDRDDGSEAEVTIPTVDLMAPNTLLFSSSNAQISDDGQRILFESFASNLVPDDDNFRSDLFLLDRSVPPAGTVQRITESAAGTGIDQFFFGEHLSADGSTVTFTSRASNLLPGDEDSDDDLFVFDELNGLRRLQNAAGEEIDGRVRDGRLSGDGRLLVFESSATNLTPTQNFGVNVYLADLESGAIERISVPPLAVDGVDSSASQAPGISPDGRFVAFWTNSSRYVEGDDSGNDLVVFDRDQGRYHVATINAAGETASYRNFRALVTPAIGYRAVEADGAAEEEVIIAFETTATNLTADSLADLEADLFLSVIRLRGEAIFANGFEALPSEAAGKAVDATPAPARTDPLLALRRQLWAEWILSRPEAAWPGNVPAELLREAQRIRAERR